MKIRRILLFIILISFIMFSNISYASKLYLLGDANKNNVVDSIDQLIIMRHIMASTRKTHPEWILTGDELKLADVTQNGVVNNSDMLAVLRYIAAKRNPEKIGNKHKEWLEIGKLDLDEKQDTELEVEPDIKTVEVDLIKLNKNRIEIDLSGSNKTVNLIATVEPSNASNKTIIYSSNNEQVATVNSRGKITAKKNGTAVITAKTSNGKTANCTVIVTTSATRINLSKKAITLKEGETKVIEGNIVPVTTSDKKVIFSSDNTSIATVEQATVKGTYYIKTKINNKVLSVEENKTTNSANIQVKDKDDRYIDSQKFDLVNAGNGYYVIRARNSGKVLDVQGNKKENSTAVIQYILSGADNQLWKLEDAGNGYYYIKSKSSGLYLDVQGGEANEGNKIIIYAQNKKDNQKFKLESTGEKNNYDNIGIGIIKAKKKGTAKITATSNNNKSLKATATITVNNKYPFPTEYIDHMKQKVIYYDYKGACHTNYTCMVDAELCRVTIFKKTNGKWELAKAYINGRYEYCAWNSFQGVNNSSRNAEGLNWYGPRSRSYKTATRIVERHELCPYGGGNKWIVEYVGPNPKYGLIDETGEHSYQRFEYAPARGDPANVPLSKRFLSQGCCVLGNNQAYWIYKNVPDDTTVVIFDKYNPLPKWYVWDVGQKGVTAYTPNPDVPTKISLSSSSIDLQVGKTKNLTVTLNPKNASHRGITYKSSNTSVATVDNKGKITAKGKGNATITVKVLGLTATCKVTVK